MSTMTIEEVMAILTEFSLIKVIYNKEVIFDDNAIDLTNGGDVNEAREMLRKLDEFSQRKEIVYSVKIKFTHLHRSIIKMKGEKIKRSVNIKNWGGNGVRKEK